MTRSLASQVLDLHDRLSERDRELIQLVGRFRYLTGRQLEHLLFDGASAATRARLARHALARLTDLGLLVRLDRRVGGIRAGSAGYVYGLAPLGAQLLRYRNGQGLVRPSGVHEPGRAFVRHVLGVSESYIRLVEAERSGRLELLAFEPEPVCWRRYIGRTGARLIVKPDAFVRVGVGAYEDRYFLEIDCGSEGRGTLLRKCRAYLDYYRSGTEQAQAGVFPKVLWVATTEVRRRQIAAVCGELPGEAQRLFAVAGPEEAVELVATGPGGAS